MVPVSSDTPFFVEVRLFCTHSQMLLSIFRKNRIFMAAFLNPTLLETSNVESHLGDLRQGSPRANISSAHVIYREYLKAEILDYLGSIRVFLSILLNMRKTKSEPSWSLFFCPKSQSFHAFHSDSGVCFPSQSAFDLTISAISCILLSFLNHSNWDNTSKTCRRSYQINGAFIFLKSVPYRTCKDAAPYFFSTNSTGILLQHEPLCYSSIDPIEITSSALQEWHKARVIFSSRSSEFTNSFETSKAIRFHGSIQPNISLLFGSVHLFPVQILPENRWWLEHRTMPMPIHCYQDPKCLGTFIGSWKGLPQTCVQTISLWSYLRRDHLFLDLYPQQRQFMEELACTFVAAQNCPGQSPVLLRVIEFSMTNHLFPRVNHFRFISDCSSKSTRVLYSTHGSPSKSHLTVSFTRLPHNTTLILQIISFKSIANGS